MIWQINLNWFKLIKILETPLQTFPFFLNNIIFILDFQLNI